VLHPIPGRCGSPRSVTHFLSTLLTFDWAKSTVVASAPPAPSAGHREPYQRLSVSLTLALWPCPPASSLNIVIVYNLICIILLVSLFLFYASLDSCHPSNISSLLSPFAFIPLLYRMGGRVCLLVRNPSHGSLSADLLAQQQKAFKCIKCPLVGREWLRLSALLIYLPVSHLHTISQAFCRNIHSRSQV